MMILRRLRQKNLAAFGSLNFTSDCHCHLLPGVDDGVQSYEESLCCLKQMLDMGIRSVTLTPHVNPEIFPDNTEESLKPLYDDFIGRLPQEITSAMSFSLGAEYMVTHGIEERDFSQMLQFQDGKVLIEMSYLYASSNIEQTLFALSMADLKPVIAHPERYLYLADSLEVFEHYHDMGAEFQMNLLSLSGVYGRGSLRILKYISDNGWYSYYGTDAHSSDTLSHISRMNFNSHLIK